MDDLPFRSHSIDGVISSSAFQWSCDISKLIKTLASVIKPGGTLAFSMFTSGSLTELQATQKAFNMQQSVIFPTVESIHTMLVQNQFTIIHQNDSDYSEQFESGFDALRAISRIGASYHEGKLLSPQKLRQFVSYLEEQFSDIVENRYCVTTFIARMEP